MVGVNKKYVTQKSWVQEEEEKREVDKKLVVNVEVEGHLGSLGKTENSLQKQPRKPANP